MPTPVGIQIDQTSADMGAYQGVTRSATRFYTSAYPNTSNAQFTLNIWGVDANEMPDTGLGVLGTRNCGSDAPGGAGAIQQINGVFYHAVDGHLYITCNNFPTNGTSWVLEYDPATLPGSGPVASHALSAFTVEGVTWSSVTGSWWVFYNGKPEIEEYNTSWVLIDQVTLPVISNTAATGYWNGAFWNGSTLHLNPHDTSADQNMYVYRYNGTSWPRFTILNKFAQPSTGAGQGVYYYNTTLYMAERRDTGHVLSCTLIYSDSDNALLFSPQGALFFNDSDTAAGNTTATGLIGTKHSIVFWCKAKAAFSAATARLVTLGSDDLQFRIYWEPAATAIWINRFWTGAGLWSIPEPSRDDTTWLGFGITYDGTSTANDPLVWMRRLGTDSGVLAQTVTESTAPTGTITPLGNGYQVGNRAARDRAFYGAFAYVQVWQGTILTQVQINAALNRPGSVAGAALYLPLTNDGLDLSGNAAHATILNAALVTGPFTIPVIPRHARNFAPQQRMCA